jgi:hypothetical protein
MGYTTKNEVTRSIGRAKRYGSFDEEDRDDEFFFISPSSRPTPFSI